MVVDFDVEDGVIVNPPRVAGDFFLEPDDALADVDRALDGLAAASDAKQIAKAIADGLRPPTPSCSGSRPSRSRSPCAAR